MEHQWKKYEMNDAHELNAYTYTTSYIVLKRPLLTDVTCMHTYYKTQMPGRYSLHIDLQVLRITD